MPTQKIKITSGSMFSFPEPTEEEKLARKQEQERLEKLRKMGSHILCVYCKKDVFEDKDGSLVGFMDRCPVTCPHCEEEICPNCGFALIGDYIECCGNNCPRCGWEHCGDCE